MKLCIALVFILGLSGCQGFGEWILVHLFYREAVLPQDQVHKDLIYWMGPDADHRKHRLDFYIPEDSGWPILIFVHGGGWSNGDKALRFGDADPYGNIGRFYAAHGVGVAVINYRLQPAVTWHEQVRDVARALAWAYRHGNEYGGNTHAIFLSGHSAGAQLATRAALDQDSLREVGLSRQVVCGVISVSGSPFDVADEKTYELGTDPAFFEKHFRTKDSGESWKYEASSVNFVTPLTPPFLLIHGRWEWKGLKRQNQLMYRSLKAAGVPSQLIVTPWEEHFLMVAALSRSDKIASKVILEFINGTMCASTD